MVFIETEIHGAFLVEIERLEDERGFFARTCSADEFAMRGLDSYWAQISLSFNRKKGTLRGIHYQLPPHEETKLVRCTMGVIYDVIVDLRPASATYRRWVGTELSAENRRQLYIPRGVAHGFQTLEHNSEVLYHISVPHRPESTAGVRWDDPAFGIQWPEAGGTISERDRSFPDYAP